MRILYLFAGKRGDRFVGVPGKDFPDTQLYGLNHLPSLGISAEHKEFYDVIPSRFFERHLGFNTRHALLFFGTKGYDIVFGSAILPMMIFKKLFGRRSKFILLNISLTRLLKKNGKLTFKGMVIRTLLKGIDAIVCFSRSQRDYLCNIEGFSQKKVFVVSQGVDISYFTPYHENAPSVRMGMTRVFQASRARNAPMPRASASGAGFVPSRSRYERGLIVSAGRDNARDYKTVIDVASSLPDIKFLIICSKRNLKGVSNVPKNVEIKFDITSSELRDAYRQARALLMTTHNESFLDGADCSGMTVLLEAFASGLPSIVTRRSSHADYVEDGKNAIFVNPYDINGIIEKIRMVFSDQLLAEELGREARKSAEQNFSTRNMAEMLKNIFNTVARAS